MFFVYRTARLHAENENSKLFSYSSKNTPIHSFIFHFAIFTSYIVLLRASVPHLSSARSVSLLPALLIHSKNLASIVRAATIYEYFNKSVLYALYRIECEYKALASERIFASRSRKKNNNNLFHSSPENARAAAFRAAAGKFLLVVVLLLLPPSPPLSR